MTRKKELNKVLIGSRELSDIRYKLDYSKWHLYCGDDGWKLFYKYPTYPYDKLGPFMEGTYSKKDVKKLRKFARDNSKIDLSNYCTMTISISTILLIWSKIFFIHNKEVSEALMFITWGLCIGMLIRMIYDLIENVHNGKASNKELKILRDGKLEYDKLVAKEIKETTEK